MKASDYYGSGKQSSEATSIKVDNSILLVLTHQCDIMIQLSSWPQSLRRREYFALFLQRGTRLFSLMLSRCHVFLLALNYVDLFPFDNIGLHQIIRIISQKNG